MKTKTIIYGVGAAIAILAAVFLINGSKKAPPVKDENPGAPASDLE